MAEPRLRKAAIAAFAALVCAGGATWWWLSGDEEPERPSVALPASFCKTPISTEPIEVLAPAPYKGIRMHTAMDGEIDGLLNRGKGGGGSCWVTVSGKTDDDGGRALHIRVQLLEETPRTQLKYYRASRRPADRREATFGPGIGWVAPTEGVLFFPCTPPKGSGFENERSLMVKAEGPDPADPEVPRAKLIKAQADLIADTARYAVTEVGCIPTPGLPQEGTLRYDE